MKYPKLKCEDKQNTKVCSLTIKKMKVMRKAKYTYDEIGDKFKVSQRTAWMYTAPAKLVSNSRKKRNEATRLEHAKKSANDSEYKKKLGLNSWHSFKKRCENDPRLKEYYLKYRREYFNQHSKELIKKHPTWSRTCALGSHATTNRIIKCKNLSENCECSCHKA